MSSSIIFLFIAIIILGGAFLAVIALTRKPALKLNQNKYRERWLIITGSVNEEQGTQQLAILNADKLLDQALKERGIKGETMGDRMKNAKTLFRDNNSVWSAHKLRNRIAHEDNARMTMKQTNNALADFRAALQDMGAL